MVCVVARSKLGPDEDVDAKRIRCYLRLLASQVSISVEQHYVGNVSSQLTYGNATPMNSKNFLTEFLSKLKRLATTSGEYFWASTKGMQGVRCVMKVIVAVGIL